MRQCQLSPPGSNLFFHSVNEVHQRICHLLGEYKFQEFTPHGNDRDASLEVASSAQLFYLWTETWSVYLRKAGDQ